MGTPGPIDLPTEDSLSDATLDIALPSGISYLLERPSGPDVCASSPFGSFVPEWEFSSLRDCSVSRTAIAFGNVPINSVLDDSFRLSGGGGASLQTSEVPLPGAALLLATGFVGVALMRRWR